MTIELEEASVDSEEESLDLDRDLHDAGREASASLENDAERVKDEGETEGEVKIAFGTFARRTTGKSSGPVMFVEKKAMEHADGSES